MARYIDADALKLDIDLSKGASIVDMALSLIKAVEEAPTADVAPRSEVDLYKRLNNELEDELASTYDKLEDAESEVAKLQAEKDALIKNYAECMKDYAREIFAELDEALAYCLESHPFAIARYNEIRKKYIGE